MSGQARDECCCVPAPATDTDMLYNCYHNTVSRDRARHWTQLLAEKPHLQKQDLHKNNKAQVLPLAKQNKQTNPISVK